MPIKTSVLSASLCLILSGCFLEQHEPKPNSIAMVPWMGVISVEDIEAGERKAASASAFFVEAKEQEPQKQVSRAAALASRVDEDTPGMKCERKIEPVKKDGDKTAATDAKSEENVMDSASQKRVSVGRLFFGPALQSSLQVFFQDANSMYRLPLEPGLAPGAYQVAAEGGRVTEPFGEILSIPEALSDVRVNRVDIREPGVVLSRDQDLEIAWKMPTVLNDQNVILIDFEVQDDDNKATVHCVGREANLTRRASDVEWTIDRSLLADFPIGVTAQVHIVRAHLRRAAVRNSMVVFQGLRTAFAMFDFAP